MVFGSTHLLKKSVLKDRLPLKKLSGSVHVKVCTHNFCTYDTLFLASFIESLGFKQQVLFRADFLCVTSDLRVHDPGWGWMSQSRTPLKC